MLPQRRHVALEEDVALVVHVPKRRREEETEGLPSHLRVRALHRQLLRRAVAPLERVDDPALVGVEHGTQLREESVEEGSDGHRRTEKRRGMVTEGRRSAEIW